jgi:hypothetical protein
VVSTVFPACGIATFVPAVTNHADEHLVSKKYSRAIAESESMHSTAGYIFQFIHYRRIWAAEAKQICRPRRRVARVKNGDFDNESQYGRKVNS